MAVLVLLLASVWFVVAVAMRLRCRFEIICGRKVVFVVDLDEQTVAASRQQKHARAIVDFLNRKAGLQGRRVVWKNGDDWLELKHRHGTLTTVTGWRGKVPK